MATQEEKDSLKMIKGLSQKYPDTSGKVLRSSGAQSLKSRVDQWTEAQYSSFEKSKNP